MMLYTSVLQPPAPQQLLALVALSCRAISAYLARTRSLISLVPEISGPYFLSVFIGKGFDPAMR